MRPYDKNVNNRLKCDDLGSSNHVNPLGVVQAYDYKFM